MTQEEKELLLKDLCGRLPYGVLVSYKGLMYTLFSVAPTQHFQITLDSSKHCGLVHISLDVDGEKPKPYLRPMSSMTEEEYNELEILAYGCDCVLYYSCLPVKCNAKFKTYNLEVIDWFNVNHFDYRGLIEKGLAIEVTEGNNPYKKFL